MRNHISVKIAAVAAAFIGGASSVMAQEATGEAEYMTACSTCHGAAGMGKGPLAELMTVPVPDLRGLTVANDGEFPLLKVIHIIDGRTGVRGHGTSMPVWGNQFKAEVEAEMGPYGSETYARGKILSLAYYLESIQEQ
ncbi:MAG: cytochrome c [Yoonia sp.]|nr:cytochrome c [Yoonia sp.]